MTQLSRRAVLRAGALTAALLPFAAVADARAATSSDALYRRSRFTPYLNGTFSVVTNAGTWKATLTAVNDLSPVRVVGDQDRFRLVFRMSTTGPTQQTCSVRKSGFTTTSLFLVPLDATNRTYEAVINRAV